MARRPSRTANRRPQSHDSSSFSISQLKQTPEVVAFCAAANRWPLLSVRAFVNQPANDGELDEAVKILCDAKEQVAELVALGSHDAASEDAEGVRALLLIGGQHAETLVDAVFALGAVYGLRLGAQGGVR